jgi:hypothetical protein
VKICAAQTCATLELCATPEFEGGGAVITVNRAINTLRVYKININIVYIYLYISRYF